MYGTGLYPLNRFRGFFRRWNEKVFVLLLFGLAIELIFFKFVPDLGTATLPSQESPSLLTNFRSFENYYLNPGTLMSARFAGTRILLGLAKLLDRHLSSSDVRLHPLRISAAISGKSIVTYQLQIIRELLLESGHLDVCEVCRNTNTAWFS